MGTGGEPSWWLGPPTLVAGLALGWYLAYRGGYVPSLLFASAPGTAPENHVRVSRPHPRIRVSRSGHPVHVVVLTGSSSSAKTTAIAAVSDRLSTLGFRVMASVTPQIPVPLSDRGLGTRERLVRSALDLEDNLIALALARDEPTVLLLDRGTPGVSTSAPSSFASVTSLVDDRSLDDRTRDTTPSFTSNSRTNHRRRRTRRAARGENTRRASSSPRPMRRRRRRSRRWRRRRLTPKARPSPSSLRRRGQTPIRTGTRGTRSNVHGRGRRIVSFQTL